MAEIPANHPTPPIASPSLTAVDVVTGVRGGATPQPAHDPTGVDNFASLLGQRFGEYELLTEVARGGMGVVYRARQVALDRIVALKMILSGRLANTEDVLRFRTEAEAAARLQHPHIVAVHDVGEHAGQHYFTMEFIDGTSLDQRLAQGPLASKVAARYVRILARAIHYAHKQGILHRDLKPSNILIDADDEPHITDFGLAKRLDGGNSGQTRTGTVLGTPSYMSPEQAQGKSSELGPASDIYSLGSILYELLTGRPPFCAESSLDTVMQVIDHQPVPPRLLNPKIDHDLETICLKCLEKDPHMRYASADQLGEDLQRYLNGDSINARSVNVLDRLARTLERDTRTADFSAWSSMLLVMAGVVFVEHFTVFMLIRMQQPHQWVTAARFLQFALLALLFWRNRRSRLLPTNAAERELWTIWIGYFLTYFFIIMATRLLTNTEAVRSARFSAAELKELLPYPFLSIISGLAFFIMGSNYWGRCYAMGAIFFAMAPLLTLELSVGPLIFGSLWFIALATLGLHLRKQGHKTEQEQAAVPSSEMPTVLVKNKK